MIISYKEKIVLSVLCVLVVVGLAAWIYQLTEGLGVTGMNNSTSWGLYITCFMFFVGLSAGGLIVASSASVFHVQDFKRVALPAVVLSTVCILMAAMFVLIDLGGIQRIGRLITGPNFLSPLLWDIGVITCYLIVNVVYLYYMVSPQADEKRVAVVSRFALPIAILVHSVTAWIFGLQLAREGWYSAILAPIFVASAMDSGLALLLVVLSILRKTKVFCADKKLFSRLSGLLAVCIAVDAFFIGCEVLTMAYPGAQGAQTLSLMSSGVTAPFFWFEVIGGLLIPFLLLVFTKNRAREKLVMVASVLVIIGVFCKRVWLLFSSFIVPNIYGAPGISSGSSAATHATGSDIWSVVGVYTPTWVELVVVLGVLSLGILIFMAMIRRLVKKEDALNARKGQSQANQAT